MSQGNGRMPEGWARVTLSDVCEINPKHDRELSDSLEVSFIPMAAVSDVRGEVMKSDSRPLGEVRKGYTHFANGDVLWAKITPCMENGKAAVARALVGGLGCGTTEFFVLRSQGAVLPDFLHRFMRQESYRKAARATMQSGVGQARVPKEFVESTEIPLPPLPEQRRIVARLEELQARTRRAREALESVPTLLEQFRQSVLASAFRGDLTADWRERHPDVEPASVLLERIRAERRRRWEAAELEKMRAKGKEPKDERWKDKYKEPEPVDASGLPELPEGWMWAALEQIVVSVSYGYTASANTEPVGPRFLRITDLQYDSVAWPEVPYCRCDYPAQYLLKAGDIVVARTGATTGKSHLIRDVPEPSIFASYLIRLETSSAFPAEHLGLFMGSYEYWRQITFVSKGSAQPGANASILSRLVVPVPPMSEIKEIVKRVEQVLSPTRSVAMKAELVGERLTGLDTSVLARAFRGELVPQDPNDEPASVLLERVREGHAQASRPRRRS